MTEQQVDNADSALQDDKDAVSSAELGEDQESLVGSDPKGEPEAKEEDPAEISRNVQDRFDVFAQEKRDLRAEIDQLKRRAPVEYTDPGAPKADDFDSDIDYAIAKGAHLGEQNAIKRFNDSLAQNEQQQVAFDQQQKVNGYQGRVAEAIKENPDFTRVVQGSLLQQKDQFGQITPATQAILELDNGPAVALHIAQNPAIAASLNQATPMQAAMTVQRLSTDLTARPAQINDNPNPVEDEDKGAGVAASDGEYPNSKGATFE